MSNLAKHLVQRSLRSIGYEVRRICPGTPRHGDDLEADLFSLVQNSRPFVVDVGANEGQRISLVKRTFSQPTITSFEPNPALAGRLRLEYASSVEVVQAA